MKEQNEKHASKLGQDIACIEVDLKEVETRNLFRMSFTVSCTHTGFPHGRGKQGLYPEDPLNSSVHYESIPGTNINEGIEGEGETPSSLSTLVFLGDSTLIH